MKRAFQLPLTEAILNAPPSQRQADRLAAPLRRRGAWSQLVEARMGAPADPKRDAAEPPAVATDVVGSGPRLPSDGLIADTQPALSLKQRLQLIVQQQGQSGKRPNNPSQAVGRNTSKAQPDFKSVDAYFDPTFDLSDPPTDKRADRTKPTPSNSLARPAGTRKPELPRATSTPAKGKDIRFAPAASSPSNAAAPLLARQKTPSPRQPPARTKTAGAKAAAQARQTMLLELIAEHQNLLPPEQLPAPSGGGARTVRRFIASTLVLAAIGAGIHWREHLVSLPRATSQVVSHWTATFLPSLLQGRPQLTLAKVTPVQSAPIEIVSTVPPARSLPTTYGIFASSKGQMIRLEPMNVRLPDSRIALPGLITKPAAVVVPHGRLSFVAYQRELMTSAPDSAQLRVVARVARTLSFSATGKPVVTAVDDTWAIRSVSVDLTVAPIPENREIVELRPANPELVLSPGRYLLVFKNQTYDFVVAGKATDKAHCLEKAETQDGETFTECRKLP